VRWSWPGGPVDAAGVEQDTEPVVIEASKAVAASFDLFDAQVEAYLEFGGRSAVGLGL